MIWALRGSLLKLRDPKYAHPGSMTHELTPHMSPLVRTLSGVIEVNLNTPKRIQITLFGGEGQTVGCS